MSITFDPIRLLRRRQKLRQAIDEEVWKLRRLHGDGARDTALRKLKRDDLTTWGRQVIGGAAKRLDAG